MRGMHPLNEGYYIFYLSTLSRKTGWPHTSTEIHIEEFCLTSVVSLSAAARDTIAADKLASICSKVSSVESTSRCPPRAPVNESPPGGIVDCRLVGWMVGWETVWSVDRLDGWLVGWLVG